MNPAPRLSVIIPAHNPDAGRLQRTLAGLRAQSLPAAEWEVLLVDNASAPPLDATAPVSHDLTNLRVVHEPQLGLSHARGRGFAEARGDFAVLVDDDNVLDPDYLSNALELFAAHPLVGALGGRSRPEFESPPAAWAEPFLGLLALRDLGDKPLVSAGLRPDGAKRNEYPPFAPIGAGMALRRAAWEAWLSSPTRTRLTDRRGSRLSSSGDNDIVLCAMQAGWEVGYFPSLGLTHLIPPGRLEPDYLARLNFGIQQSWMELLIVHQAGPWAPLTAVGAYMRVVRAWFSHRPWTSPAARIRWQGARGHFLGRIRR